MATTTAFDWATCEDPAEMRERINGAISDHKAECFVNACRNIAQPGGNWKSSEGGPTFAYWLYGPEIFGIQDRVWFQKATPKIRADVLREIFPPPLSKRCPECNSDVIPIQRSFYPVPLTYCVKCDFSGPPWPDWIKYPFPDEWRTPTVIGLAQRIDGSESESCDQCFGHGWYDWYPEDDPTNSRLEGGIETKCSKCDGEGRIEKQGEPDFSAMPILADALEEAGCDDEAILRHCRQTRRQVRCMAGCQITPCDDRYRVYESAGPDSRWELCESCNGAGFVSEPVQHLRGNWVIDLILGRE